MLFLGTIVRNRFLKRNFEFLLLGPILAEKLVIFYVKRSKKMTVNKKMNIKIKKTEMRKTMFAKPIS
jgi:hypothetical protein